MDKKQIVELDEENPIGVTIEVITLPERGKLVRTRNGSIWYEFQDYIGLPVAMAILHNPNHEEEVKAHVMKLFKPIKDMYERAHWDVCHVLISEGEEDHARKV